MDGTLVYKLQNWYHICSNKLHLHILNFPTASGWAGQWLKKRSIFLLCHVMLLPRESRNSPKISCHPGSHIVTQSAWQKPCVFDIMVVWFSCNLKWNSVPSKFMQTWNIFINLHDLAACSIKCVCFIRQ